MRALLRLLLLALGRTKEAAKEARFLLLDVDFKILVIIQLRGGQLSSFIRLRRRRFVGVEAVRHKSHGLEKNEKTKGEKVRGAPYVH